MDPITHLTSSDPFNQDSVSGVTRALETRLLDLESMLLALAGGDQQQYLNQAPVADSVRDYMFVYFDSSNNHYAPAVAWASLTPTTAELTQKARVVGVAINVANRRADIVYSGVFTDVLSGGLASIATQLLEPGLSWVPGARYYLSEHVPGSITNRQTSLEISVGRSGKAEFFVDLNMSPPTIQTHVEKLAIGMRPKGGLRVVANRSTGQRISAFDGLEDAGGGSWISTKESATEVIAANGWFHAEITWVVTSTSKQSLVLVIESNTGNTDLIVYTAENLETFFDGNLINTDVVSPTSGTDYSFDIVSATGETLAICSLRLTSADISVARWGVLRFPDSFVGWKQVIEPAEGPSAADDPTVPLTWTDEQEPIAPGMIRTYEDDFIDPVTGAVFPIPETPLFDSPVPPEAESGYIKRYFTLKVTSTTLPGPTGDRSGTLDIETTAGAQSLSVEGRYKDNYIIVRTDDDSQDEPPVGNYVATDVQGDLTLAPEIAVPTTVNLYYYDAATFPGDPTPLWWSAVRTPVAIDESIIGARVAFYDSSGTDITDTVVISEVSEPRVWGTAGSYFVILNCQIDTMAEGVTMQIFQRPAFYYDAATDLAFRAVWPQYNYGAIEFTLNGTELITALLNEANRDYYGGEIPELGVSRKTVYWTTDDGSLTPWDFNFDTLAAASVITPKKESDRFYISGSEEGVLWEPAAAPEGLIERGYLFTSRVARRLNGGYVRTLTAQSPLELVQLGFSGAAPATTEFTGNLLLRLAQTNMIIGSWVMNLAVVAGSRARIFRNTSNRTAVVTGVIVHLDEIKNTLSSQAVLNFGSPGGYNGNVQAAYQDFAAAVTVALYNQGQAQLVKNSTDSFNAIGPSGEFFATLTSAPTFTQLAGVSNLMQVSFNVIGYYL